MSGTSLVMLFTLAFLADGCRNLPSGKEEHMRQELLRHEAMNKNYIDFTSDSAMLEVVRYYDAYGTANEQMKAHYLLGCVYRDIGQSPMAIHCYHDAISKADTSAADCDFSVLSSIYDQMAHVYHLQLLLTPEAQALRQASHYAFKAGNTYWGIYELNMLAGAYMLLNRKDSAEVLVKRVCDLYRQNGYTQPAFSASKMLMSLYLEQPEKLDSVRILIERFEAESGFFDADGDLPLQQRKFFGYKAKYLEETGQLDSAEFYYRRLAYPGMTHTAHDPMYHGLMQVFLKRRQADSLAKYTQLYCMANDSSIALKDQNLTAQMAASYNYSRYQKEALAKETKISRMLILLIIALVIIMAAAIVSAEMWLRYKSRIKSLKAEFARVTEEYEESLRQLQMLEDLQQRVEFSDAFEPERALLTAEISILKDKIEELKHENIISTGLKQSETFANDPTVSLVRQMARRPLNKIDDNTWEMLLKAFADNYPLLYHDINRESKGSIPMIQVGVMTAIGLRNIEQESLLGLTKQQVSNYKSTINMRLFGDRSSRSLYKNLVVRYNIYIV